MKSFFVLVLLMALVRSSKQDVANIDRVCSLLGKYYSRGCSEFAADAFRRGFKPTSGYKYKGSASGQRLTPGQLLGWPGHLLIYAGGACRPGCTYVNVRGPGHRAQCQGSMGQPLQYASYY